MKLFMCGVNTLIGNGWNLEIKKLNQSIKVRYKDGKPNGLGVLISTNGWKYFGSWKNGEIWNGTEYDKDGNIRYRWVNGEYTKQ